MRPAQVNVGRAGKLVWLRFNILRALSSKLSSLPRSYRSKKRTLLVHQCKQDEQPLIANSSFLLTITLLHGIIRSYLHVSSKSAIPFDVTRCTCSWSASAFFAYAGTLIILVRDGTERQNHDSNQVSIKMKFTHFYGDYDIMNVDSTKKLIRLMKDTAQIGSILSELSCTIHYERATRKAE